MLQRFNEPSSRPSLIESLRIQPRLRHSQRGIKEPIFETAASWSGRIPKDEAKKLLIKRFGPVCWGCGCELRRPNGSVDDTLLEVDHISAKKAAEGEQGDDELYNLALPHRTCNGIKRNKMTLEELRTYNTHHGILYVNGLRDLVDLFTAPKYAFEQVMKRGYQQTLFE